MTREMKNSGVEWIGDIPCEWEIEKTSRICNTITDYVASGSFASLSENVKYLDEPNYAMLIRTADVSNKGYNSKPVYVDEHAYNFLRNSNLYGGELLLPNIGGVGEVYIVPKLYEKMTLAPNAIIIRTDYCDKYYYYYFCSDAGFMSIKEISQSTAQPKFNKTDFRQIKVLLPPLQEQKKIADFLDSKVREIDKIIFETKASIENYKEYKQSVITEAVTKGLDKNVPMKDSGIEWIGKIPCEWKVCKLKFFSKMISKGTTPKDMRTEIDHKYCVRYLKSENIVSNDLRLEPEFSITKDINEELKRSQLEINDILFVIAGASIGKTAIVPEEFLPANTNQAVSFIRLEKEFLDYKKYVWYFLQSRIIPTVIALYSVQSAQPNLSMENLGNIKLAISKNKLEIFKIVDYLDAKNAEIDNLISKKEKLITNLEEYKKSLIYEYVTGKKAVE